MFGVAILVGLIVGCGGGSEIEMPSDPPIPPSEFVGLTEPEPEKGASDASGAAAEQVKGTPDGQTAPSEAGDENAEPGTAPDASTADAPDPAPSGE